MTGLAGLSAALLSAVPLGAAWLLVRRVRRHRDVSWAFAAALAAFGVLAAAFAVLAERALLRLTDPALEGQAPTRVSALLSLLLFAAPLEEAAKVVVVWPAVATRRLDGPGLGMTFAVCVASGFAAAETASFLVSSEFAAVRVVRAAAGLPAHAFAAGLWGYALGDRVRGGRWFGVAWVFAVLLHALYDYIVFERGPGLLVLSIPMLGAMAFVTWSALRDIAPRPASERSSFPIHLPEPPSLRAVRQALRSRDRPLMLRWIVLGAFVNVGAVITCMAVAVVLARRLGVDLALADESDMRSNGPLVLVGAAVLAAFPIAGFLVARASGAHTVLEPAFAAGLSIAVAVAVLSLTAPSGVVFALAIAPLAFGLACGGAWFGMDA